MAFIVIKRVADLPDECVRRDCIEQCFLYCSDRKLIDASMLEYGDLLQTELLFKKLQPEKLLEIQRKFKNFHLQGSYSEYGKNLLRIFPKSYLLKAILAEYKVKPTRDKQTAMVEFDYLMDVLKAFNQMTTKSGGHKTYHPTYETTLETCVTKEPHSNTIHGPPGHLGHHRNDKQLAPINHDGHMYYPEQMYKQLENHTKQQEEDIKRMQTEIREKTKDLDELRNRLSGLASKQLTQGNPDFTDLSDKNRPMKIAEFFHTIYDDEWTTALEALTHVKKGSSSQTEENAIQFLMEIIKSGYAFCSNYADKQRKNMLELWHSCVDDPFRSAYSVGISQSEPSSVPQTVVDSFKEMRRARPNECLKSVVKAFRENMLKTKKTPAVDAYVDKCIEVIWLMRIQDPPMFLKWPTYGDRFDPDIYKEYCRKGSTIKLAVWPAVFLHEKGALMNKGFAMPQ